MNFLFIYGLGAGIFLILESLSSWRKQARYSQRVRWNVGLALVGLLALRVLGMAGVLRTGAGSHWEMLPAVLQWILGFLLLDLFQYFVHRAFHFFPLLWKLHRIHHMDTELDWSTGMRRHFLEMVLSFWIRVLFARRLGIPLQVFVAFEGALILARLWIHSNWKLPKHREAMLQRFLMTPSLHRIHHSQEEYERITNFGTLFSFWDRRLESYKPKFDGDLSWGVRGFRDDATKWMRLLWLPFLKG